MADTLQHGSISGSAAVRQRISGEVVIGGKIMKELRFLPYSEFPEIGREETLYIDTDNNAMYYYDGSAYVALSGGGGGGTDNYNALSNKPSVNSVTLIGNKTSSELGLQELISDLSAIRSGATSGSTAVQPETLETALSEKQDTINDLDAIRNGASAGATAVQPSDMETALSSKQDVISDLSDIRSGAASGATAVQPSDMETALSGKQDSISDLQTIRSGAALGATAVQPSDMETALADKQDVISDLDTIRSGATAGNTALQPEDIDTLPTDGSSNPVSSGGTYNFVNSSIATNTAYFIGTFASVAELEAYTGTVTNNDYAFVTSTDSAGNTLYNRYKYNAATLVWSFEYAVNNTAFTTAQWAAIQSGMTASDKTKLDGIEQGANKTVIDASPTSGSDNAVSSGGVHTALSGKQDTIADLSDIRSGASAGATAVQPSALNDYQTKLSGTNKLDPSFIDYDASHRAVSDTEKSTWNGKQDEISDLSTIRSGSAAGATALQQSDVASTYSATGTAPVNGTAVNAAIGTLDVGSVGGSGKYISAISEENGKIAATPTNFDTSLSSSSTNNNAPTSKAVYDDQQRQEVEIGVIANAGAKNLFKNDKYAGATVKSQGATWVFDATSVEAKVSGSVLDIWSDVYLLNSSLDLSDKEYKIVVESDSPNLFIYIPGNTLSGGNIPSSGQYYPGVYKYKGIMRTSTRFTAKTASYSNNTIRCMICSASITDSTFQPYALPNPTLTPAAIKAVDEGAKNIADFTSATKTTYTTATFHGVTITRNGDIFTISGTSDTNDNAFFNIYYEGSTTTKIIPPGNWVALIEDYTGSVVKDIAIQIAAPAVPPAKPYGTPIKFSLSGSESGNWLRVNLRPSTTYNGSFRLMICSQEDYAISTAYVPYALPNPTLTPAAIKAVDEGAKNLLRNTASSQVVGGVTFTVNADGTITANGTKTNNDWFYLSVGNKLKADTYVLSSGLAPQDDSSIRILIATAGGLGSVIMGTEGGQQVHTKQLTSDYTGLYYAIRISSGTTVNNVVFKQMLCTAADWAVSQKFVPYRPSWQEMWEMIQALQNDS